MDRVVPASARSGGFSPSRPIASYRSAQSRIVERPSRVRVVPGMSHSREDRRCRIASFPPFGTGPFTSSLMTPYRNTPISSRSFSSIQSSLKGAGTIPATSGRYDVSGGSVTMQRSVEARWTPSRARPWRRNPVGPRSSTRCLSHSQALRRTSVPGWEPNA